MSEVLGLPYQARRVLEATPKAASSSLRYFNGNRFIGDGSFASPINAKYYFQSADDGQAFRVGTNDWVAMLRVNLGQKPTDSNTAVADSDAWPISFGRDVSNHAVLRFRPSPNNLAQFLWKLSDTNLIDTTLGLVGESTSATSMIFIRKTGRTLKIGIIRVDTYKGLIVTSSEATASVPLDLDTIMGSTGRMCLNIRYPGATPDGCAISSVFLASLNPGRTWADVEFETDEQIIQSMLDPDRMSQFAGQFNLIRSFDLCDSSGNRKLFNQRAALTAGDKLVCIHSGVELIGTQLASPTATPLGCAPYETASQNATLQATRPQPFGIGNNICLTLPGGAVSQNQDARLTVLSRTDGYRVKPDIPLIPVALIADASDGDAIKPVYGWNGRSNLGDNHTQYVAAWDAVNDRVVVFGTYHSELYSDDIPDTDDTWYSSGWVAIYDSNGVVQKPVPHAGLATANHNAITYGAVYAHTDGNVYSCVRAGGTEDGRQRLIRVDAKGDITAEIFTRTATANPEGCKAAIPQEIVPVGDYLAIALGTRISGSSDYVGVGFAIVDPKHFDSDTEGWYKGATGENFAPAKISLATSDPDIYPIPGPGKSALIAYAADPENYTIDPSAWAYGEAPIEVFSYGEFVGVIARRGADADRSNAYLQFSQWMLHVLKLNGTALELVSSFDLTSVFNTVAGGYRADVADGTTVKDYEFSRVAAVMKGKSLDLYVYRSDGQSIVDQAVGTNAINVGASVGKVTFVDWTNPSNPYPTPGALFPASDYGGATMLAFGVHQHGLLFQAIPEDAVVRATNAAEAFTTFKIR